MVTKIAIIDLETTGINVKTDKIVSICVLDFDDKEFKPVFKQLVNPLIPIPPEASKVNGITNESVKNCKTFEMIAKSLLEVLNGYTHITTFNGMGFDIPLLVNEFKRTNIKFDSHKFKYVDTRLVYKETVKSNLAGVYNFYTGKTIKNAHTAEGDCIATGAILEEQLKDFSIEHLEYLSKKNHTETSSNYKLSIDKQSNYVINFGKHKGEKLSWLKDNEANYFEWARHTDLNAYAMNIIDKI
jgi:DNA polymerase-3 subunit epsilon